MLQNVILSVFSRYVVRKPPAAADKKVTRVYKKDIGVIKYLVSQVLFLVDSLPGKYFFFDNCPSVYYENTQALLFDGVE